MVCPGQAGSMPEMAVNTMPTTTTTIMNFQQVFHHWGKLILHTARPATVMPAVGLMVFMVWLAMHRAVTEASVLTPIRSVSGAMTGMVRAARPEEEGTRMLRNAWAKYILSLIHI